MQVFIVTVYQDSLYSETKIIIGYRDSLSEAKALARSVVTDSYYDHLRTLGKDPIVETEFLEQDLLYQDEGIVTVYSCSFCDAGGYGINANIEMVHYNQAFDCEQEEVVPVSTPTSFYINTQHIGGVIPKT